MTVFWALRMNRVHEKPAKARKGHSRQREQPGERRGPLRFAGSHHTFSVKGQVASIPGLWLPHGLLQTLLFLILFLLFLLFLHNLYKKEKKKKTTALSPWPLFWQGRGLEGGYIGLASVVQ